MVLRILTILIGILLSTPVYAGYNVHIYAEDIRVADANSDCQKITLTNGPTRKVVRCLSSNVNRRMYLYFKIPHGTGNGNPTLQFRVRYQASGGGTTTWKFTPIATGNKTISTAVPTPGATSFTSISGDTLFNDLTLRKSTGYSNPVIIWNAGVGTAGTINTEQCTWNTCSDTFAKVLVEDQNSSISIMDIREIEVRIE